MTKTKLKSAAAGALIVAGIATPLFIRYDRALRGENDELRGQVEHLSALKRLKTEAPTQAQNDQQQPKINGMPRESWNYAGYADPESAFQTAMWARREGDVKAFRASITPDGLAARRIENKPEDALAEDLARSVLQTSGYRPVDKAFLSDDEVIITILIEDNVRFRMERLDGQWKLAGMARRE